jgi:hypothetical protein
MEVPMQVAQLTNDLTSLASLSAGLTPLGEVGEEGRDSMRQGNDDRDALRTAPDSLSLADLAYYVSGADDRRRAGDQVMERLSELVAEIDADAKLHLARRGRAERLGAMPSNPNPLMS